MPKHKLRSLSTSQDKHSQFDEKVPIGSFLRIYIIMTSTVLDKSYEYIWKSHLNISQFRLGSNQSVITTDGLSLALARVVTVTLSTTRPPINPEWLPGALFIHNTLHNNIIQAVQWS